MRTFAFSTMATAVLFAATTAAAFAATVTVNSGNVSLNQGNGFNQINGSVDAQDGDRVLVQTGGAATISFADGCSVQLGDPVTRSIATISRTQLCAAATQTFNPSATTVVAGAVVGGAVIAGVVIASSNGNSNSKPASP